MNYDQDFLNLPLEPNRNVSHFFEWLLHCAVTFCPACHVADVPIKTIEV